MHQLEHDEVKGGYARLLTLIELGVKSAEDAVELMKKRLTSSREEFVSLRHSDALLETTAQISYEKVRDTYTNLLRLSHKRANDNDLQWIELETKWREWMMNEMKSVLNRYISNGSNFSEFERNQSDRIHQHRLAASRRLQKFGDKLITSSQKNTEKIEKYDEISLRMKKLQAFAWRKKQFDICNDWLYSTEREISDCYADSINELSEKISEIRAQLNYLDIHAKKLTHLSRLSNEKYELLRSKSIQSRRNSVRSSLNGNNNSHNSNSHNNNKLRDPKSKDLKDDPPIPPIVSMNIGTRLWNLSKSVGVENDECLNLLTQLFYTINADPITLQRISQHISHYETILTTRKS